MKECECCLTIKEDECPIKNRGRGSDCPCNECLLRSICVDYCTPWQELLNTVFSDD